MKPQIKIEFPKAVHVVAWSSPRISYRIIAKNGETLLACSQGFERESGLRKNIASLSDLFLDRLAFQSAVEIKIYWVNNAKSKTIINVTSITV